MTKKFLIGIVAAAAMVGCIKRTEVTPATGTLGSATISGTILMNTNETNDTLNNHLSGTGQPANYQTDYENMAGIEVIAWYDTDELDQNYTAGVTQKSVRTETAADGSFTLTVETPAGGSISVDLTYEDQLNANVTFDADSTGGGTEKITVMDSWSADGNETTSVTVRDEETVELGSFEYTR